MSIRIGNNVAFKANYNANGYENPINRNTERNLAILESVGGSVFVGTIAGGFTTCMAKGWKKPTLVGALAAIATLALTLPAKLYNTKVSAFTREKEMDVFSTQKSAQSNLYSDINDEIKDKTVSLDDKVNHYSTVKMADNGRGMMVKGA